MSGEAGAKEARVIDKREFCAVVGQTQPATGGRSTACEERPGRQCLLTAPSGSSSKKRRGFEVEVRLRIFFPVKGMT